MIEGIRFNIGIIKLLLESKLHSFYKKVDRMLNIRLNNYVYFTFTFVKAIIYFAIMMFFIKVYYDSKYDDAIMYIYTLLIVLFNFNFITDGCKNTINPYNVELFQMSSKEHNNISVIFIISEYIWCKFKEIDLIIPTFLCMISLYGGVIIVHSLLIEVTILLLCVCRTNIFNKKKIINKISIFHLLRYFIINCIFILLSYNIFSLIIKPCKWLRRIFTSFDSLNDENYLKLEEEFNLRFYDYIENAKSFFSIKILNNYNSMTALIVILVMILLIFLVLRYTKIDYSLRDIKLKTNESMIKKAYIDILKKVAGEKKFLILKDLSIMENTIKVLKKDFFSTVILPYDFFVINTLMFVVIKNISNTNVVILFSIFCVTSIIFNQVNTIVVTIEEVFKFKEDLKSSALYKNSKYDVKDLLKSKIELCMYMSFLPFIITIICAVSIFVYKFGVSLNLLIAVVILLISSTSIYFFSPKISLYVYAYNMNFEGEKLEEELQENEERLVRKFYEIPKNLLILPLMYFLLLNSCIKLIYGSTWMYVIIIYLVLNTSLIVCENHTINKMLKRGM